MPPSMNQEPGTRNKEQSTSHEIEVLVRVEGVSKKFCRDLKKSLWYGMKDVASELLPFGKKGSGVRSQGSDPADSSSSLTPASRLLPPEPSLRPGEFWANKDISFELRRGECLGLIGRNGAGKTTLLKMLNGLIKPDEGTIEMRGRVGALIALGAGFNPILTGRENIYVNGSILGLTKAEIDAKIDEIIDFAEIPDFIDSPVQSYSSGMQVRLGFAVATALNPDVLILDEVLAVGDAAFRAKCYNRIGKLLKDTAVIFVSHNINQVAQICNRGLFLRNGESVYSGGVEGCITAYTEQGEKDSRGAISSDSFNRTNPPLTIGIATLTKPSVAHGEAIEIELKLSTTQTEDPIQIRVAVYDRMQTIVCEWDSKRAEKDYRIQKGDNLIRLSIGPILLRAGDYKLSIAVNDKTGVFMLFWAYQTCEIFVNGPATGPSTYLLPLTGSPKLRSLQS